MAIFCLKKIDWPPRTGEILRQRRREQRLTVEQVSAFSHIPPKYIVALEKNRCKNLPPTKAHCLGCLRKYAAVLRLNSDEMVKQFIRENNLDDYQTIHPHRRLKIGSIDPIVIWTKRVVLCLVLLSLVGYLFWQINGILQPPRLTILSPAEGYISNDIKIVVQGKTEKETVLRINGQKVNTNEQGRFETDVNLSKGVNTITISVTKKHGKTTTVTRHVVRKESFARPNDILTLNN